MATSAKRFKADSVMELYRTAYKSTFNWADILPVPLFRYLQLFSIEKNCPITVSMGSLIPLVAAVCGPNTTMLVRGPSYKQPLNTYMFIVSAPGGGKSVAFANIINEVATQIKKEKDLNIVIETYSVAGLQRHQTENKGKYYFKIFLYNIETYP